ncbi:MAG: CPBP family intramembrane metalloprotease [Clostridiales Family XIII bacterium]|nr:CPBP family intramembrane metalloprotease [Clostridiales Family XIII bacterium]
MKKFFEVFFKTAAFFAAWTILLRVFGLSRTTAGRVFLWDPALTEVWSQLLAFFSLTVVSFLSVRIVERGRLRTRIATKAPRDALAGTVVGCLWIGGTLGLLVITGSIEFGESQSIGEPVYWVLSVLINVIVREYLIHGYVFTLLRNRYDDLIAVAVTSVIFAALKAGAVESGTVSILFAFATGVLLSLLRIYTNGLLAPIIAHFIWNAVGCLVIGGVSLGDHYPSVWKETLSGIDIISGGELKFEGSGLALVTTVVLIDLVVILINDAREAKMKTASADGADGSASGAQRAASGFAKIETPHMPPGSELSSARRDTFVSSGAEKFTGTIDDGKERR